MAIEPKLEGLYKFEVAPGEWQTGTCMTYVRDETIGLEHFFVTGHGAQRTVQVMVPNIQNRVVTSFALEPVEAADEKQLFETYERLRAA